MATTTIRPHAHGGAAALVEKPDLWFDYQLQAWIKHDIVQRCGHHFMPGFEGRCCNQARYAHMFIWEARERHGLCGCDDCCAAQWRDQ